MSEKQYPTRGQIEQAVAEGNGWPRLTVDLVLALFPQPTPSAETPVCECGHAMNRHTQASGCTAGWSSETYGCRCGMVPASVAAPQSIADMAPGTTFTARVKLPGAVDDRFTVMSGPVNIWLRGEQYEVTMPDRIDPSTIRDVTPPESPNAQ